MLNAQKLSNKVQFTTIAICHPGIIMSIPSLKQPSSIACYARKRSTNRGDTMLTLFDELTMTLLNSAVAGNMSSGFGKTFGI